MTDYQNRMWRMLVLSVRLNRPDDVIMFRYNVFMRSIGEL